jgi:hypothetical protein
MRGGAFYTPSLVDNPFEHPYDGITLERAARLHAMRSHVPQHFGFAVGLVHLEAKGFLQLPDFQRTMCAFVEQFDQLLIELIDPTPELVDGHVCCRVYNATPGLRT